MEETIVEKLNIEIEEFKSKVNEKMNEKKILRNAIDTEIKLLMKQIRQRIRAKNAMTGNKYYKPKVKKTENVE